MKTPSQQYAPEQNQTPITSEASYNLLPKNTSLLQGEKLEIRNNLLHC